jgi:hypothetical protein
MTHFAFVSPFDQPGYVPQDGDTWMDFRETKWASEDGSVRHGKDLVSRKFSNGEWREYNPMDDYPEDIRRMVEEIKAERARPE